MHHSVFDTYSMLQYNINKLKICFDLCLKTPLNKYFYPYQNVEFQMDDSLA